MSFLSTKLFFEIVDEEKEPKANVWRKIWNYMMGESGSSDNIVERTTTPASTYNQSWHVGEWTHVSVDYIYT